VIVVPVIDLKTLTYANLIKDKEAIYCVASEQDLTKLESISKETYESMMEHMKRYRNLFTLGGMCEYILLRIKTKPL
jgi:hypothetical protein